MYTYPETIDLQEPQPSPALNEAINEIIRGEISAHEAYSQVIEKVSDELEKEILKEFSIDHKDAIEYWKRQSLYEGIEPDSNSSVWGTVVEAFVGISKLVGEDAAIKALIKGEEHGRGMYEDMLSSNILTVLQKSEIESRFIPIQQKHIETLEKIIK